jgi:hypothetical protein
LPRWGFLFRCVLCGSGCPHQRHPDGLRQPQARQDTDRSAAGGGRA